MVDDVEIQSALCFIVARFPTAFQFILPVGHDHEPRVGTGDDLVEKCHLNVSFEHDLFFSGKRTVGGVGKRLDPCVIFFQIDQLL